MCQSSGGDMKQPTNRDGELLFSRYAYPCAFDRCMNHHISEKHYDELTKCALQGIAPPRSMLRFCFPHAFRGLRRFAAEHGLERWAVATVRAFWRTSHGHTGDCRIIDASVVRTVRNTAEVINSDGKKFFAVNLYGLQLDQCDKVFIHRRAIVEREDT